MRPSCSFNITAPYQSWPARRPTPRKLIINLRGRSQHPAAQHSTMRSSPNAAAMRTGTQSATRTHTQQVHTTARVKTARTDRAYLAGSLMFWNDVLMGRRADTGAPTVSHFRCAGPGPRDAKENRDAERVLAANARALNLSAPDAGRTGRSLVAAVHAARAPRSRVMINNLSRAQCAAMWRRGMDDDNRATARVRSVRNVGRTTSCVYVCMPSAAAQCISSACGELYAVV